MADTKITQLQPPQLGYPVVPATDVLPIVVIADPGMATSGSTRKVTVNQLLGAGGTATLASATITGDLTVRTNKLAVTSTGVGIGTASPALPFAVSNAGAQGFEINPNGSIVSGGIDILSYNRSTSLYKGIGFGAESYLFRVGTVSVSDAMTLNSTGLGVGMSPVTGFNVGATGGNDGDLYFNTLIRNTGTAATSQPRTGILFSGYYVGSSTFANFAGITGGKENSTSGNSAGFLSLCTAANGGSPTARLTVDSVGTVGVGVTPSTWTAFKVLQVGSGLAIASSGVSNSRMFGNTYYDGAYKYVGTGTATQYEQDGYHRWYIATSGTAGGLINGTGTFTSAMTLTTAGSLVLGAAAVATTATDGFLYIPGCAGTPTGTPTSQTGRVPLVVDTTNNKLYFYSGGSWVAAN